MAESTRLLIAGVPRAGKTTLAMQLGKSLGIDVRHTDSLVGLGWSESSAAAAKWIEDPGPWIIEGVAVPRALRKWLAARESGVLCDELRWMPNSWVRHTPGQATMAKGCITVWSEILPALIARGVKITTVQAGGL